jgi:hypothetical protein
LKRGAIAIVVALACGLAVWLATRSPEPRETTGSTLKPAPETTTPAPPPEISTPPQELVQLPITVEAAALNSPAQTAEDDIAILTSLLGEYRRHFGGNPTGDNDEITASLRGGNPKRLACLPADSGDAIDSGGRLIDRWGTPYFFHALSGREMEILSAGPDREFHTADDIRGEP